MTSLKELQESFQRGILAGDDTILSEIKDSPKEKRKVLFGVYRNAYVARLAEVLADDYEQVHAYLGDAGFAKLAKSYIAAHPSDRRSARDFGRHVPDFLKTDPAFAAHAEVAEIAALEKALADAFDGPEAEPLSLAALAEVAPELWTRLVFTPHPTALRVTFATNAADIWSALRDESAPPPPRRLPEPQAILVWRQDVTARFKPLGHRGSDDVGRSRCRHALRRALRDGGDLWRRRRRRLPRRELSQGLGRHGEPGGLPACVVARSQPPATALGAGKSELVLPASR